jgi:hypothetical protein
VADRAASRAGLRDESAERPKSLFRDLAFTAYDDVRLAMYPAAAAPPEYAVQDWESAGEAWVIEPSLRYRYRPEVTLTDPPDPEMLRALYEGRFQAEEVVQWVPLHEDTGIGLLMVKDGDSYTLRSRYFGLDGQPR